MVFFLVGKQILISSECCEMFLFRIPQSIGEREIGGGGGERGKREREREGTFLGHFFSKIYSTVMFAGYPSAL